LRKRIKLRLIKPSHFMDAFVVLQDGIDGIQNFAQFLLIAPSAERLEETNRTIAMDFPHSIVASERSVNPVNVIAAPAGYGKEWFVVFNLTNFKSARPKACLDHFRNRAARNPIIILPDFP
jgi:hypothetical protein